VTAGCGLARQEEGEGRIVGPRTIPGARERGAWNREILAPPHVDQSIGRGERCVTVTHSNSRNRPGTGDTHRRGLPLSFHGKDSVLLRRDASPQPDVRRSSTLESDFLICPSPRSPFSVPSTEGMLLPRYSPASWGKFGENIYHLSPIEGFLQYPFVLWQLATLLQCGFNAMNWQTRQLQELVPVTGVEVRVLSSAHKTGQGFTAITEPLAL
jgi:hypothetical protein